MANFGARANPCPNPCKPALVIFAQLIRPTRTFARLGAWARSSPKPFAPASLTFSQLKKSRSTKANLGACTSPCPTAFTAASPTFSQCEKFSRASVRLDVFARSCPRPCTPASVSFLQQRQFRVTAVNSALSLQTLPQACSSESSRFPQTASSESPASVSTKCRLILSSLCAGRSACPSACTKSPPIFPPPVRSRPAQFCNCSPIPMAFCAASKGPFNSNGSAASFIAWMLSAVTLLVANSEVAPRTRSLLLARSNPPSSLRTVSMIIFLSSGFEACASSRSVFKACSIPCRGNSPPRLRQTCSGGSSPHASFWPKSAGAGVDVSV
mmetsp:Transcript_98219/g.262410  ORF Transcript_98219/g.262410 Transcript_98219/m.262410 type:complete len:326 (+) Transcript_98219:565-1542(+)